MNGFTNRLIAMLAASVLALAVALVYATVDSVDTARAQGANQSLPAQAQTGLPEQATQNGPSEHAPSDIPTGGGQGDPRPENGSEPAPAHEQVGLGEPRTPERGESLNIQPEQGEVRVRLPGQSESVPISEASSLPVGSIIDARHGAVRLVAAATPAGGRQSATFSGAVFKVVQPRTAGVTEIRLVGQRFGPCSARASVFGRSYAPIASAARRRVRRLWATGKGRFATRGSHGVATVRGTTWMTADSCRGTLVRVKHGVVDVRDLVRKRTVVVRAGKQYLAKKRS